MRKKKYYNMDIQRINQHTSAFNEITHYIESDNGKEKVEVWFARELQSVLGYARWENFTIAIGRAVESCKSQNINVNDHFICILSPHNNRNLKSVLRSVPLLLRLVRQNLLRSH